MAVRPFVHLHCHTHYSLLDGANRIPELIAHVKEQGMNAVAITDHGNLFGAIEFYRACTDAGLNPIIGYEAYVAPGPRTDRTARRRGEAANHLTLLAKNQAGFKNLIRMASLAYTEGFYHVPRIDKELLEAHHEGLICLSGCASSEFSEFILKDDLTQAKELARWFHRLFGNDFYIEVQNNGLKVQTACAEGAIDIANDLGLPLVATSDAHYLRREDAPAHDVLLCINTRKLLDDPARMRYGDGDGKMIDQFYVCGPDEMYVRFAGREEAVKRSQEIADGCHLQLDLKKRYFPVFTPPKAQTAEEYLRELCEAGLNERYGSASPERQQQARQRLEHELGIICRMGFASYFLIVWDFVRFALSRGIPAGARGSGCGAIVSYVLKLSNVCPLEYDLLFERFLDPNRSEAPDIDIDFCQDRREEVIAYVREKYGDKSVAQIATFGTMAAKAAIKDVGRVLNVPLERVNRLTAMVPKVLNISLDDALAQSPELRREYDSDPDVRKLIDIARKLEGTNRNVGTHAAGVVIANGDITEYVPVQRVQRREGGDGEPITTTQWVMGDLEKVGLLKMDFLGLRTLTVIDNTLRLIEKTRGIKLDLENIPLDDAATYRLLQKGDARGVFQLESDGIRELLKRMRPDNIRDLIATNALYRPGPLGGGMVDAYINRKHGREKPVYVHPVMEEILKETYGVMTYQEQIMRILNRLGGIELASAYACIKAISKKKHDIIDARRLDFLKGAQERGMSERTAQEIFDLICYFAGYGFNKCVVGETVIMDAHTGERTTVGELFANRRPFTIHALGSDNRLHPRLVSDVVWNGRKVVYRLTTELGKVITATANHPLRTFDGWTNLGELKPGDRIAVPRHLTITAGEHWPTHEVIALAGLLSEGNTCHPTSLYFYGNDPALTHDFADAVAQFPDTVARITSRRQGIHEVCANTGPRRKAVPGAAYVRPPSRSGAFRWAEQLGILGKRATEKTVPSGVFRLCDTDLERFLGRLWAGDGLIANASFKVPFYATSSRQLAIDVQTLLLRLGMVSRIHCKQFHYRGQLRPGYTIHVLGADSVETFLRRLAPHCVGREHAVAVLAQHVASTPRGLSNKDTIPPRVRSTVDRERQTAGLTWREVEAQSGVSMKEFYGNGSKLKRGFRRATLARLADFFGSPSLGEVARSHIFWDRVVSIEKVGIRDTFDLTVNEDHNFVADGVVVHNSHSSAYAILGYQTAYLKAHYTPEFMAALLSSEIDDSNKRDILFEHIEDARRLGAPLLPPNIQEGEANFTVKDGKIVFGLLAVKGVGRGAIDAVVRARAETGSFRSFYDFCERVDHKLIPKSALERLIKVGAFDCIGANRRQLMEAMPRAIAAVEQAQRDRRQGQLNLFEALSGDNGAEGPAEELPEVAEWPALEKLRYEKEALDFYITSHPLTQYREVLERFAGHRVEMLPSCDHNQEVFLGGILTQVRFQNTKKARNGNTRFVRCKLEDVTGAAECLMWPDDLAKYKDVVEDDRVCFASGIVDKSRDQLIVQLTRVLTLEQGQKERTTGLVVTLDLTADADRDSRLLDALAGALRRAPRGPCPVFLYMRDGGGRWLRLKAGEEYRINPVTLAKGELEAIVGAGRSSSRGRDRCARGRRLRVSVWQCAAANPQAGKPARRQILSNSAQFPRNLAAGARKLPIHV